MANVAVRIDVDADAGEPGGLGVAADRVRVAAEGRAREEEAAHEREAEPDEDRVVDPPRVAEPEGREALGLHGDEVSARDDLREAVDDDRRGQGRHERVDAAERDQ